MKNNILVTNASLSWQAYRFDKELSKIEGTYSEEEDIKNFLGILVII